MNKKVFLLILFIFLLCGCSSEVNINIDGKNISEEVNITYMADSNHTKGDVLSSFRKYMPAFYDVVLLDAEPDEKNDGIKYYERSINEYENGYLFNYKYSFNTNNYLKARSVKKAFKSLNINNDTKENILVISSDNSGVMLLNQYPELSSVTINITTTNEVLETNGTKKGSKYTWVFNQQDNNKGIYIKMKLKDNGVKNEVVNVSTPHKEEEQNFIVKFFNEHPIMVMVFGIIIFLLVMLIVCKISRIKYE